MKAMKVLGTLLLVGLAACVTNPADDADEAAKSASSVEEEKEEAPSCFCNGCTKVCESNGVKTQGTCC